VSLAGFCRGHLVGRLDQKRQERALTSTGAFFGLSTFSVWGLRLGIGIERIRPGDSQQNSRHERVRLILTREATRPAGRNLLPQLANFAKLIHDYDYECPRQALGRKYRTEFYRPPPRPYTACQSWNIRCMTASSPSSGAGACAFPIVRSISAPRLRRSERRRPVNQRLHLND